MEGREFGSKPGSGGAASASVRLGLHAGDFGLGCADALRA